MTTLQRRALTLPLLGLATVLLVTTLPLWLPLSALLALLHPGARAAPRVLGFFTLYLLCESAGVLVAAWLWLRHGRNPEAFLEANYELQSWWASTLKRGAAWLFRLRFEVTGTEAFAGSAAPIVLPRHSSMGDTVLPVVFFALPTGVRLRYVLKRELLFDPCLDIVGQRLPNYFARRGAGATEQEVAGVVKLLTTMPNHHGLLLYPEGTRFSEGKRRAVLARLREKGDEKALARAEAWPSLLPPRPGGLRGVLAHNPGRDLLLLAHRGFEKSASFSELFNGSWLDTTVQLHFWRVPFAELPKAPEAQVEFINGLWDAMQNALNRLEVARP
jgi:1-acyl-sn-glycerol-3-phosphate acyltransferase